MAALPPLALGIQAGTYRVAAQAVFGGAVPFAGATLPIYSFELDLNGYNLATTFSVRCPINPFDTRNPKSQTTDWNAIFQQACDQGQPLTCDIQISYESVPAGSQTPTRMMTLEQGHVDQITLDLAANEQTFICRTAGAILQDTRIQGGLPQKFPYASQAVSYLLATYAKFLPASGITVIPSLYQIGHSFTEADYQKSVRGQSVWDYISQLAQDDGYILTIHNQKAYYGPPGSYPGAPTLAYAWGKDLVECRIDHAARRSRNIQVVVTGINQRRQARILAYYPVNVSQATEKYYIDVKHNHTKSSASAFAQQQYTEIITKEFVIEAELIPDTALLQTLSAFGPHFYVNFAGIPASAAKPTYHCKQAHVALTNGDSDAEVRVLLTCENHVGTSNS